MLSEKLRFLLDILNTDNTEISRCAGCSASNISRLKSGSRIPSKNSRTIKKLSEGICCFARSSGTQELLSLVVGSEVTSDMDESVIDWLYDDAPPELPPELSSVFQNDKAAVFGKKLDALMKLADVTNSRLSKTLSIDASYISRFRRGERVPKAGSKLMYNISTDLSAKIVEQQKLPWLAELLSSGEELTEANAARQVIRWLSSGIDSEVIAVRQLLESMKQKTKELNVVLPDFDDIVTENVLMDKTDIYKGTEGLQRAMLRFIGTAVKNGSKELWLYSDRDIGWMTGDFLPSWLSLINRCVQNGIKLKLIHSNEVKAAELLTAINSWLPLYVSGLIEPYHCSKKSGDRFVHTIFIDPENDCVVSCCVKGAENYCNYYYLCDETSLSFHKNSFNLILEDSKPMITYNKTSLHPENADKSYELDDMEIIICKDKVIINTLSDPCASFELTQPQICRVFRDYAEEICK